MRGLAAIVAGWCGHGNALAVRVTVGRRLLRGLCVGKILRPQRCHHHRSQEQTHKRLGKGSHPAKKSDAQVCPKMQSLGKFF